MTDEMKYMRRYGGYGDGTLLDNVTEKRLSHLEVESLVNEQAERIIRLENETDHLQTVLDMQSKWNEQERRLKEKYRRTAEKMATSIRHLQRKYENDDPKSEVLSELEKLIES